MCEFFLYNVQYPLPAPKGILGTDCIDPRALPFCCIICTRLPLLPARTSAARACVACGSHVGSLQCSGLGRGT
ncbi:hypothetical protein IscW_ISCW002751 [Ixodes scapularis]|uniref:Uncharacterized protein n=1 Tax=Ixodes scapularis TaxID=6945 RepID=B7PB84_IXOSC|nr:hypothetical protein IscW_ISCW002751 [Ixodes scapularis]|eukprot:XP_002407739.1 hypothetical protein IscW_ISCW002751 [Ixodes scapularis]